RRRTGRLLAADEVRGAHQRGSGPDRLPHPGRLRAVPGAPGRGPRERRGDPARRGERLHPGRGPLDPGARGLRGPPAAAQDPLTSLSPEGGEGEEEGQGAPEERRLGKGRKSAVRAWAGRRRASRSPPWTGPPCAWRRSTRGRTGPPPCPAGRRRTG